MEKPIIQEFLCKQNVKQTIGLEGIPKMDERMAREMWETVHQKAIEEWANSNDSPPITEIEMESLDWDKQPPLREFGEKPTRSEDEFQTLEAQDKIEPSELG